MRTTRAFIAGLGTAGSLVAAVVCAFVVGSAVVAYKGFPGLSPGASTGGLMVDDAPIAVAARRPAPPVRVKTAPARPATTASTTRRDAGARSGGGNPVHRDAAPSGPDQAAPVTPPSTPAPPTDVAPSDQSGPGSPGDGGGKTPPVKLPNPVIKLPAPVDKVADDTTKLLTDTTDGLGQALDNTVSGVGSAVGQASPTLGGTVTGVGHLLGGVTKAVGNTLGGTLKLLVGAGVTTAADAPTVGATDPAP